MLIKVEMLGGFSVWADGRLVAKGGNKLTKPWQLFCYLVLHRDKYVSKRRLISVLWADDPLTDPANVLKNAVYSLRKELCGGAEAGPGGSPVLHSTGGYRFDPEVSLQLDADDFSALCAKAAAAPGGSPYKAELCEAVVKAYRGDLLPQLEQELWVAPLALDYRRSYLECAHELFELLWQKKQYRELEETAGAALRADALDEDSMVYLFRAMNALKMYRVIVTTYSKMAQEYSDALGAQPPEEAQRIYAAASEHINKTEQDIIVIKTELTGMEQAARPQRGALFCSYSNLRHVYGLMKRSAERGGQVLVLVLFTIGPARNTDDTRFDPARAMAEFKVVAMNNLRKTDAMARYSRLQYAALLCVGSLEDGRLARDRIKESFAQATSGRHIVVDTKLTEV